MESAFVILVLKVNSVRKNTVMIIVQEMVFVIIITAIVIRAGLELLVKKLLAQMIVLTTVYV